MPEYVIEPTALYKVLLHSLKYPSAPVCGVLLAKTANKDVIQFADAIPILHTPILSLPVEIALAQVHAHATRNGAQVMGFYQANERADDTQLGGAARKVADVVATLAPEGLRGAACALLVNTAALKQVLHQQQAAAIFDVYTLDGKTWNKGGSSRATLPPVAEVHGAMQRHVAAGKHTEVVDFEDHLEDIGKSWLNEALLS